MVIVTGIEIAAFVTRGSTPIATDPAQKHNARIIPLHYIGVIPPSLYMEKGFADVPATLKRAKEREAEEEVTAMKKRLEEFVGSQNG